MRIFVHAKPPIKHKRLQNLTQRISRLIEGARAKKTQDGTSKTQDGRPKLVHPLIGSCKQNKNPPMQQSDEVHSHPQLGSIRMPQWYGTRVTNITHAGNFTCKQLLRSCMVLEQAYTPRRGTAPKHHGNINTSHQPHKQAMRSRLQREKQRLRNKNSNATPDDTPCSGTAERQEGSAPPKQQHTQYGRAEGASANTTSPEHSPCGASGSAHSAQQAREDKHTAMPTSRKEVGRTTQQTTTWKAGA